MDIKISAVINTFNEEKNVERVIRSVSWVDEVIVCDMYSEDKTVEVAKRLGAKIFLHKRTSYVEPARNFAISKAKGDWILVLDADEEMPDSLAEKLQQLISNINISFVEIPRKNIIFGKWMKAAGWWPDYHVRFFKKGAVVWSDQIHSKPQTKGQGLTLEEKGELAIVHHHYGNVFQFIERMNRYTAIQAKELKRGGYKFSWTDLISQPVDEFLSRFFARQGFRDGLHGLTLSLLQAFSHLVLYTKLWEMEKFSQQDLKLSEVEEITKETKKKLNYWLRHSGSPQNPVKKFLHSIKRWMI